MKMIVVIGNIRTDIAISVKETKKRFGVNFL